jgi:hypothetical protein
VEWSDLELAVQSSTDHNARELGLLQADFVTACAPKLVARCGSCFAPLSPEADDLTKLG